MNKKNGIIAGVIALIILPVVALTVYMVGQRQTVSTKAQTASTQQVASCPAPAQVTNVSVDYPDDTVTPNSFTSAACHWTAVAGAASYAVTITQVETNTVVKTDTTTNNQYSFPITQNDTYECSVAAVASCGTQGPAGTAQAVCSANGLVASPTITPTPTVVAVPGVATPTPTPGPSVCGYSCTTTTGCAAGLVCVTATSGQGYCALPNLQQECIAAPSLSACCIPPVVVTTPRPTIPATGDTQDTLIAGAGVVSTIATGIFLLLKAGL